MLQKDFTDITELRRALHRHPELSMQESRTIKILQDFLREHTSLEIHPRKGWFYACKKGRGSSQCSPSGTPAADFGFPASAAPIAFRADMDALPIPETIALPYGSQNEGVSHKCGHDGHSAALCGLALELDRMETKRDVYLIFQPGEEIGAGAALCKELIREKGIGEIYAMHNLGGYPEGSLVYRRGLTQPASEGLRICLKGKTSHASAPEKGKNPAGAMAEIVEFALHTAAALADTAAVTDGNQVPETIDTPAQDTEQAAPMRLCTITGIRLGDGDFGISPGEGEICMTLRAEVEAEMLAMEQALLAYAAQISDGAGLQITYSIHDYFPETRNHDVCLDRVLDAAQANKIPAIPMQELWRASEDFGAYLKECPGAMFYIGNGENYPPLHTAEYDYNDRILEKTVDLFLSLV